MATIATPTPASAPGYSRRRTVAVAKDAATYAALIIACFITFSPILFVLATSLTNTYSKVTDLSALLEPTFDNYVAALFETSIGRWAVNSLIVSVVVTAVVLIIDSLAGYAFARRKFRGREPLFMLLIATLMVPATVTFLPLFLLSNSLGLINTLPALILPALAYAVGVFLMRQFIETIPSELEDAARIDGLSDLAIFARIILPLSIPGLATLGIFTFMTTWSAFLWPIIITSSDAARTLPAGLATLPGQYNTNWGLVCAGTLLSMIPLMIVFLVFQRYLMAGILGGRAGKG